MGKAISTLGMGLRYAVETTAGTRPTTGYINIPDIKEIPDFNPEPGAIETTDLSQTEFKTYTKGLKDLGGALAFLANDTVELQAAWEALMTAYEAADADGKAVWFEIFHPKLENSTYFTGEPSELGLGGAQVDSALETNCYVTPTNGPKRHAKSTVAAG